MGRNAFGDFSQGMGEMSQFGVYTGSLLFLHRAQRGFAGGEEIGGRNRVFDKTADLGPVERGDRITAASPGGYF